MNLSPGKFGAFVIDLFFDGSAQDRNQKMSFTSRDRWMRTQSTVAALLFMLIPTTASAEDRCTRSRMLMTRRSVASNALSGEDAIRREQSGSGMDISVSPYGERLLYPV
jgi:hypothetical protein